MVLTPFHGFCMALAGSVPGVSGGTVAFILGFYDRFINALHDLLGRDNAARKTALAYLLKLGVGGIVGMGLCASLLAGLFAMWGILKKAPKGWKDVIILAVFGFFGILLVVGPLLDTSTFFTVATSYDAASVLAVYLAGVPVNCGHGAAVALTMLLFGKPLLERLQRIQIKYGMMEP